MGPKLRQQDESLLYCVVLGCKNDGHELMLWKKSRCNLHTGTHGTCRLCKPPFTLYRFPDTPSLRKLWLQRIGLPTLEISDLTRVCNIHFVEGKPTQRSLYPTLYLVPDLSDEDEDDDDDENCMEGIPPTQGHEDPLADHDSEQQDNLDSNGNGSFPTIVGTLSLPSYIDSFEIEEEEEEVELYQNTKVEVETTELNTESKPEVEEPSTLTEIKVNDDKVKIEPKPGEQANNSHLESANDQNHEEITDGLQGQQRQSNAKTDDDDEVEIVYNSVPSKTTPMGIWDPQTQTLQIANPVQYILQCHSRIAQLNVEKDEMKKKFELEIAQLKSQNDILKRRLINSGRTRIKIVPRKRKANTDNGSPVVTKTRKLPERMSTYRRKYT